MTELMVNITEEDIANGRVLCNRSCPIALAFRKLFPNEDVIVNSMMVKVGCQYKQFHHSHESLRWMHKFDYNEGVQPVTLRFFEHIT